MSKVINFQGKPFHFIGIGGIGMSALAYILAKRGLLVSGSDLRSSHITERLQEVGAHIFSSQEPSNLDFFQSGSKADMEALALAGGSPLTGVPKHREERHTTDNLPQVICSTAISPDNSEYQAAQVKDCPIFHRSNLLAALVQEYEGIAVAGTHGKTTTSSLIGYMLVRAGLDPTIIVGGEVNAWGGNARLGQGDWLVAEADESDGSLTKISAHLGIVTNIELDHPDHYQSLGEVVEIFRVFQSQCDKLIGCIDCPTVREQLRPQISYSLQPGLEADYTVAQINYHGSGSQAQVLERGKPLGTLQINLLGQHNLSNALAAVAVGRYLGLDFAVIAEALATFEGARRRFEYRGQRNGIQFIDDYAHHPSEIQATLTAARFRAQQENPTQQQGRVVAIFQPHRYSRTLAFLEEFAQSFAAADLVVVTDIYSAGETQPDNLDGEKVAEVIAKHHPQVLYHGSLSSLSSFLWATLQPGDLALFLGAGNLNQTIPTMLVSEPNP